MSVLTDAINILIPSGVKEDKLYTFKGDDYTFSRNSTKTIFNQYGKIETVPLNTPPINWIGGKPCLSNEVERTNLAEYSEPTQSSEVGSSVDVTYQAYSWDIGFTNSVFFGDNSTVRLIYFGSVTSGVEYTLFTFLEMTNGSEPIVGTGGGADLSIRIGGSSSVTTTNYNIPNTNVWLIKALRVSNLTTGNNGILKLTGNTANTFNVIGFQLIEGDAPMDNSYIPTDGAITTRLADAPQLTPTTGITQITEYFEDGTTNVITTIPSTYEPSKGQITKIIAE